MILKEVIYAIGFLVLILVASFIAIDKVNSGNYMEYNPVDPNIDMYYDRDSGRGDSNYE